MRSVHRKKGKMFVLTVVVVLLGLLLISCPDGPTSDPCPGNAGCTCGGSGCTHDDCHCTPPPTTKDFTFGGVNCIASKSISPPSVTSGIDKRVKFDGTYVSIDVSSTYLRIIDGEYGWESSPRSAEDNILLSGLTSPVVYGNSGEGWYLAETAYVTVPTSKSFTFNGSKTANKSFVVPSTSAVSQKDVKFAGTTVSIRATVNDLIIIDAENYGWQAHASMSTGDSGTIIGNLTLPIRVYAKNGSVWYQADMDYVDPPTPEPTTDLVAEYALLGLKSNPVNAANLISAMNGRYALAQFKPGASTQFYPDLGTPAVTETVNGETLPGFDIYNRDPEMIFLIKGTDFTFWGRNDEYTSDITISFDIAIIRNSDGKGWLQQKPNGDAFYTETYAYGTNHSTSFSLSGLTTNPGESVGAITNASDLTGYSFYIIVRNTSSLTVLIGTDFNKHSTIPERNVIKPVIR